MLVTVIAVMVLLSAYVYYEPSVSVVYPDRGLMVLLWYNSWHGRASTRKYVTIYKSW